MDRELGFCRVPVVVEELGEDPQAVAGFLRLGPVGVEDPHGEIGGRVVHAQEDTVRTDTEMAIATGKKAV